MGFLLLLWFLVLFGTASHSSPARHGWPGALLSIVQAGLELLTSPSPFRLLWLQALSHHTQLNIDSCSKGKSSGTSAPELRSEVELGSEQPVWCQHTLTRETAEPHFPKLATERHPHFGAAGSCCLTTRKPSVPNWFF